MRMFCKGLAELRKSVLPLAMATVTMVAGTYVAFSSAAAAAATAESRTLSSTSATSWRLARSRKDLRTRIRRCLLGTRCGCEDHQHRRVQRRREHH